jgi:O-succinylbenzoic acid--CoA ligase
VGALQTAGLASGDLVAVTLPPGPEWTGIVRDIWDAGAALVPIDSRLPQGEARALLGRARPTVVLSADGISRPREGIPADDGIALVVHTSGTVGPPKLAQFDRNAIGTAVAASALALGAVPSDRWLCCLPLAHIGGLLVLLRAVLLGSSVSVHPRFDPTAVVAERDIAFLSLVPTMLVRLLDAGADLSRFRAILVGGAPLPTDLRACAEASGARVVETYGLTESCGGVVYEGRPLAGVEARIDDEGGIELRGPMIMLGYRPDPEPAPHVFTADGWLKTGDAGAIDADGRLRVRGRLDDLIISGGEKVWPDEVEDALRGHPKVADVAVAGSPDPEWGQRVVAYVVPVDPLAAPTLAELRDHAARTLARFKTPRELVLLLGELPYTASGKVRRVLLPRIAARGVSGGN